MSDPLADAAVASLFASGIRPTKGIDPLTAVEAHADTGDQACAAFVAATSVLPDWVNPALVERGRRVALSLAVPTGVVLLLGGLCEVHSVSSIASVLGATGRLQTRTWLRMLETGRFIRDVHTRDGLRPHGEGLRAVIRVRLVHAIIRRALGAGNPEHRSAIDQRELAFTLCAHSHVVRRGLARLGVTMTANEQCAHQHLWRVVGHAMGIEPRLLAHDATAEAALYEQLRTELVGGDDAVSRTLVGTTIKTIAARSHLPHAMVRAVARRLVGRQLAERLEIEPAAGATAVLTAATAIVRGLNALRRAVPLTTLALAPMGKAFADIVVATDPGRSEPVGIAAARDFHHRRAAAPPRRPLTLTAMERRPDAT